MLSKSQAKIFFLGGTILFGGIFIALTFDSMKQVPERTHENNLTESVIKGKKIWDKNNCMGCHTLFGEGAYYAPELTKVYERRGESWLKVFLKDPEAMFPGQRKMVNYHFTETQIEDVIAFLKWSGEVDLNGFPAKPPLANLMKKEKVSQTETVSEKNIRPGIYQSLCTPCHSIGGEGGVVGPALDSVFARKTKIEITEWLVDPQKIKPGTLMPKLPLSILQIDSLSEYLTSLGGAQ